MDRFTKHVEANNPKDILTLDEFLKLRTEVIRNLEEQKKKSADPAGKLLRSEMSIPVRISDKGREQEKEKKHPTFGTRNNFSTSAASAPDGACYQTRKCPETVGTWPRCCRTRLFVDRRLY